MITRYFLNILPAGLLIFYLSVGYTLAQKPVIHEETESILTYPFHDPNPIPILISNPKIYPYHLFEGYSYTGEKMPWKVVTLENDHIRLFVLPEVGGKLWGAIDKSTGHEFIYLNEVLKFRDIAMRGPWTSGGIEFNFGIIGHSPSTASKVDYLIRENEDGSVSCFVGNMDLPSRTHWRVEIRLSENNSFFETSALWYNPTPLTQSYYNWMTAAAVARDDLEFYCPGDTYLTHGGDPYSWPVTEEGRKISWYKNNDFGSSKSYHITGTFEEFFGGYYHDTEVGFGHWAPYEEMPGHKLWLWALSRKGGIWEDLLTDTDSQYIEFQAGRLFNQYSPGNGPNPIRQAGFAPYMTDSWNEVWLPFKKIGGMSDVSPFGVLHVTENKDMLQIGIDPLQPIRDSLLVRSGEAVLYREFLDLAPREVYDKKVDLPGMPRHWEVVVGDRKLYYSNNNDSLDIKRPFQAPADYTISEIQQLYNEGIDALYFREYDKALENFLELINEDPSHTGALLGLGELYNRKREYDSAFTFINKVLVQNTYNARANYLAGLGYRNKGDRINALESFGWAARSMEYRSAAYTQMAEIYTSFNRFDEAMKYASKALDFNQHNIAALLTFSITARKTGQQELGISALEKLIELDPLNHFGRYELYLVEGTGEALSKFRDPVTNEFPEETYLEIALFYYNLGLDEDAIHVLNLGPESVKNNLWLAYLYRIREPERSHQLFSGIIEASPSFVYPYRAETIPVLAWADSQTDSWKMDYYLALNYAAINKKERAFSLLRNLEDEPDFWPFYVTRAGLSAGSAPEAIENDLEKAWKLEPGQWRTWHKLVSFYQEHGSADKARELALEAYKKFPDNYTIGFLYAKSLLQSGYYESCIDVLMNLRILPFEGSFESRIVYEKAHLNLAVDLITEKKFNKAETILQQALEWPENIGVGKPYNPDQRRQEFLLAYCYQELGNEAKYREFIRQIIDFTEQDAPLTGVDVLGLLASKATDNKFLDEISIEKMLSGIHLPADTKKWIRNQLEKENLHLSGLFANDQSIIHLSRIMDLQDGV